MEDVLDYLKGKLVKVLFIDGDNPRAIRGVLHAVGTDIIHLKTLSNDFFINRSRVIKIQPEGSNGDSNASRE